MKSSRALLIAVLAAILTIGCDKPSNKLAEDQDGDGVTEFQGDCNDEDPQIYPGAAFNESESACMRDSDGDGWGDDSVLATDSATAGTDCDDSDPLTFPGAAENEPGLLCLTDADEDGWGAATVGSDCDDNDPTSTNTTTDQDCDGVLTAADCDDGDAELPAPMDPDCRSGTYAGDIEVEEFMFTIAGNLAGTLEFDRSPQFFSEGTLTLEGEEGYTSSVLITGHVIDDALAGTISFTHYLDVELEAEWTGYFDWSGTLVGNFSTTLDLPIVSVPIEGRFEMDKVD